MCDGLELVYDDESGKWVEAPEIYGSIAFETQEALEKAVNILNNYKWTSVDEALPEDCVEVLVYDKECKIIMGWYNKAENIWSADFVGELEAVTHWQPLPDLPDATKG